MTTMPTQPATTNAEPLSGRDAYPTDHARQKRHRKRALRHALDRVMWTAAGAALGAGLVTITVYIMIGDWI